MIGEARDWETVEYVADAVSAGRRDKTDREVAGGNGKRQRRIT